MRYLALYSFPCFLPVLLAAGLAAKTAHSNNKQFLFLSTPAVWDNTVFARAGTGRSEGTAKPKPTHLELAGYWPRPVPWKHIKSASFNPQHYGMNIAISVYPDSTIDVMPADLAERLIWFRVLRKHCVEPEREPTEPPA